MARGRGRARRVSRVEARRQARADRAQARIDGRVERQSSRSNAREVAFENNANPNPVATGIVDSAGSVAETFFQNRANIVNAQQGNPLQRDWSVDASFNQGNPMMLPILGIGALVLIMSMNKK